MNKITPNYTVKNAGLLIQLPYFQSKLFDPLEGETLLKEKYIGLFHFDVSIDLQSSKAANGSVSLLTKQLVKFH